MMRKEDLMRQLGLGDYELKVGEGAEVETSTEDEDFNTSVHADRLRFFADTGQATLSYIKDKEHEAELANKHLLSLAEPLLNFTGLLSIEPNTLIKHFNGLDVELLATQTLVCPWIVRLGEDKKVFFGSNIILAIAISKILHGTTED